MMFKFAAVFAMKPGLDPEETYQIWLKDHVPYVRKTQLPELKKYVIGRVIHNVPGENFYGAVQISRTKISRMLLEHRPGRMPAPGMNL
jgi:hypothetical protein